MKLYTEDQIKEAFTKTFLHAGELWFSYFEDEDGKKPGFESIEQTWEEFLDKLNLSS